MTCVSCGRHVIDTPWGRLWHQQIHHDDREETP